MCSYFKSVNYCIMYFEISLSSLVKNYVIIFICRGGGGDVASTCTCVLLQFIHCVHNSYVYSTCTSVGRVVVHSAYKISCCQQTGRS